MIRNIKIVEFFDREYQGPKGRIIIMSCVGSLCFALLLAIANLGALAAGLEGDIRKIGLMILYFLIATIAIYCKLNTLNSTTTMAEASVQNVRIRLIDKLRHTELPFIETRQKGEIYSRIVQDTELISQTSANIINTFEAALASIAVFFYIMTISFTGFVLAFISIIGTYVIFFFRYFQIKEEMKQARIREADFFDLLSDTLSGFKEIKINRLKNDDLFADVEVLAQEIEQVQLNADLQFNGTILMTIALFYVQLAAVVFVVPIFSHTHGETIGALVPAVLFIAGLLGMTLQGTSVNVRANAAVENLEKLEADIDQFLSAKTPAPAAVSPWKDFSQIKLSSAIYQYTDRDGKILFTLWPIDLTIKRGETLFIVGGNGSGKTTLLKLITGLYDPLPGGWISVDDQIVRPQNRQALRELFSIIFSDFHLFEKLYGAGAVDEETVEYYLEKMEIQWKTGYVDGRFTNTDLSTGQRKRLAYIAAVLEDKPICVFDEWAADQDPEFRRKFYEEFIGDLKALEKTIIAVSHDDRYFNAADRVIKMEEGKASELQ